MIKIWSDTAPLNFPVDRDAWKKRINEIALLIPQPVTRERGNNINYVDKVFTLLADCGLITKEIAEKLNDKNYCDSQITFGAELPPCTMNPLGGVLRKNGLTMWDKNNLRYYCPPEELVVPSDIETAQIKQFKGASKLSVVCGEDVYYISNDWFSGDKPRPTKYNFYFWVASLTEKACTKYWQQKNLELLKEKNDADRKILISEKDLNFIIESLKNLTAQVEELKNLWKQNFERR